MTGVPGGARRSEPNGGSELPSPGAGERRTRAAQSLRRRRRDLVEDIVAAVIVAVAALLIAPGLGVIALVGIPVLVLLLATLARERVGDRRRRDPPPPAIR